MNPENETRNGYQGAWAQNECLKPECHAQPGEWCIWTGEPNERFPEPEGTKRSPHASRKYSEG